MKALKRLGCVLLAVLLLMSLAAPAFATGGEEEAGPTYPEYQVENKEGNNVKAGTSINVKIVSDDLTKGHNFMAYQLFAGDVYANGATRTLSNVSWGAALKDNAEAQAALRSVVNTEEGADAVKTAAAFSDLTKDPSTDGNKLARRLAAGMKDVEMSGKSFAWDENTPGYWANLEVGYYLILDETPTEDAPEENFAFSNFIVDAVYVEGMTIAPKADYPKLEKEVLDVNDSTGDPAGAWGKSADHDVGDVIPFQITVTLPNNYETYKTYRLVIHDEMAPGLTYNKDAVLYAVEGESRTAFKYTTASVETKADGSTYLQVSFADLKKTEGAPKLTGGQQLVLTYTATLNEGAAFRNKNTAWLEYSNDPDSTGSGDGTPGTGTTPKETAVVFTYEGTVNKVDGSTETKEPLAGAGFTLYKLKKEDNKPVWDEIDKLEDPELTTFTFKGLDDGIYRLVETQVPEGYNKCDDIYFQVTAEHTETASTLKVTQMVLDEEKSVLNPIPDEEDTDAIKLTFTPTNEGKFDTTVENLRGLVLPETGGIGTTIFYVVGGILVAAALVLLITKKRMSKEG